SIVAFFLRFCTQFCPDRGYSKPGCTRCCSLVYSCTHRRRTLFEGVLVQRLAVHRIELASQSALGRIANGQKATAAGGVRSIDALIRRWHRLNVLVVRRSATEFMNRTAVALVDRMILPVAISVHQHDVG